MKATVLVVEDDDQVRALLCEWLGATFPDTHLTEARSGEEAVSLAPTALPDIVLMDIGLPKMNGIEATRRIKSTTPGAHVVMLTIHEDPEYRADAANAGASAFVPKRKVHSELVPVLVSLLSQLGGG